MTDSSLPEHRAAVLRMSHPCPYPEWYLLELPNGMWAAFWYAALDIVHATLILEGPESQRHRQTSGLPEAEKRAGRRIGKDYSTHRKGGKNGKVSY